MSQVWDNEDMLPLPKTMKIYLAATYARHPEMNRIAGRLRGLHYEVTSRWITGEHNDIPAPLCARDDMEDLLQADTVLFFTPESGQGKGKGGRHTEFGVALGVGKRIIIIGERENVFHWLPGVEVVPSLERAIDALQQGKLNFSGKENVME